MKRRFFVLCAPFRIILKKRTKKKKMLFDNRTVERRLSGPPVYESSIIRIAIDIFRTRRMKMDNFDEQIS